MVVVRVQRSCISLLHVLLAYPLRTYGKDWTSRLNESHSLHTVDTSNLKYDAGYERLMYFSESQHQQRLFRLA